MQMGMVKQILAPGVKDRKEADFSAEMFRIGGDRQQRLGGGTEENVVDGALVLQGNVGNLVGNGKYDVKIRGLQDLGLAVLDPFGARQGLALGTVTIRTRVKPDALVAAPLTHLDVAAESGGAAQLNRGHDSTLSRRQHGAELLTIRFAVAAENIRHAQLRAIHKSGRLALLGRDRGLCLWIDRTRKQIQRAGGGTHFRDGDSQIVCRCREATMPE